MRSAFVVALVARARAAGVIEDHTLSWHAAGLKNALAAGHEAALPSALFDAVVAAAPRVQGESTGGETYKFGKHNTWWLPLQNSNGQLPPPQSAIEAAVHVLYKLDFANAPTPIVGAEWWLQERKPTENIGFHYDKDEAYASEHMTMRFPEVSTVTYLGDAGAPTLILNQTTPDGNEEVPPLPVEAALVYPAPNKHLVFRGNLQVSFLLPTASYFFPFTTPATFCHSLQHGVSGELTISSAPSDARPSEARRRTLLINWWRYMPMPPNCVPFEPARWEKLQLH